MSKKFIHIMIDVSETENVGVEYFTEDNGFTVNDIKAINDLDAGQFYICEFITVNYVTLRIA